MEAKRRYSGQTAESSYRQVLIQNYWNPNENSKIINISFT